MIWIISFCSIVMLVLDYIFTRELRVSKPRQDRWFYLLALTDIIPTAIHIPTYLFSADNVALLGTVSRWAMFAFLIIAIARQPFVIVYIISSKRWLRVIGAMCSLCVTLIFTHGMAVTRTNYLIQEVEIASTQLPQSFDGYRIVFFSDLHIGTIVKPQKQLHKIVEICNSLNADMVAFGGDLIDIRYNEISPSLAQELQHLKSKDGVYAITGNHDIGVYIRDSIRLSPKENTRRLMQLEQSIGWQVLDNTTKYIHRGNDSISITGISFSQALQEDRHSKDMSRVELDSIYADLPKRCFNITLSHMPQLWDNILSLHPTDLTLAGHVHAMQIAIKVGQWRISPAMLLYKRWSGLYCENEKYLYINDGIGCGLYPMRIGARPEITLLELKSKQNQVFCHN